MTELNWNTFQAAYKTASADKKALIDSGFIPGCIEKVIQAHSLDETNQRDLLKLYTHFLLGNIPEQTVIQEMTQLGIPESKTIFTDITNCVNQSTQTDTLLPQTEPEHSSSQSDLLT